MSELIVFGFEDKHRAEEANGLLHRLHQDSLIVLEGTAIILKDSDERVWIQQGLDRKMHNISETTRNTAVGLLAGVLLGLPILGALGGIVGGLIWKRLTEVPFAHEFLEEVRETLQPGTSALFVLVSSADGSSDADDTVIAELRKYNPSVLKTTLSPETEANLQQALGATDTTSLTRQPLEIKRVRVIVNPAAGRERPILKPLNAIFRAAGVEWDIALTQHSGDAHRFAAEAAAAGVDAVAIYGGDGSVMEAASGLVGTDVPLAILPGGTGNVTSVELGIPYDVREAASVIVNSRSTLRSVDLGVVGDRYFMLRLSTGYEAEMVRNTSRAAKDTLGKMAYSLSALQQELKVYRYHLTLDGKEVETEGITCIIANSGNIGFPQLPLLSQISVSDGLLDVLVIKWGNLSGLFSPNPEDAAHAEAQFIQRWRVREVTITTDDPSSVQADGEIWDDTPVTARVLPSAVKVIVP